jgi:hypothetical protein
MSTDTFILKQFPIGEVVCKHARTLKKLLNPVADCQLQR